VRTLVSAESKSERRDLILKNQWQGLGSHKETIRPAGLAPSEVEVDTSASATYVCSYSTNDSHVYIPGMSVIILPVMLDPNLCQAGPLAGTRLLRLLNLIPYPRVHRKGGPLPLFLTPTAQVYARSIQTSTSPMSTFIAIKDCLSSCSTCAWVVPQDPCVSMRIFSIILLY
jgi:hypothetical protein